MTESPPPTATPVLRELQWVHAMLRRDLAACRELAAAAAAGASAAEIRAGVEELQSRGALWQLRVNCLSYCSFVQAHHRGEDVTLFPAVRRAAPELSSVVDRLEADHRRVSDLLDAVEDSARDIGVGTSRPDARQRLVESLTALSTDLLEHLAFEEESLAPVLLDWDRWPFA